MGDYTSPTSGMAGQQETFASNLNKLPSQGFMDMKRKQMQDEEDKQQRANAGRMNGSQQKEMQGPDGEKI